MPKFRVTHYTTVTETYEVEAETGEQAQEMVISGEHDEPPVESRQGCEPAGYFWVPISE